MMSARPTTRQHVDAIFHQADTRLQCELEAAADWLLEAHRHHADMVKAAHSRHREAIGRAEGLLDTTQVLGGLESLG